MSPQEQRSEKLDGEHVPGGGDAGAACSMGRHGAQEHFREEGIA